MTLGGYAAHSRNVRILESGGGVEVTNSATSCAMMPKQIYFYSIPLVAAVLTCAAYKSEKT
jgi:hypothetical protein